MAGKHAPLFVVLHDLESARSEIAAALREARPHQRPGLEEALNILDRHLVTTDEQRVREWVRRTLRSAGVDPADDHVRAVKAVREAVPGLGLTAAHRLVSDL